jgi:hypothetical protein
MRDVYMARQLARQRRDSDGISSGRDRRFAYIERIVFDRTLSVGSSPFMVELIR